MPSNRVQLPFRLDPETKYKLQYIADNNFRPVNKEIERLVLQYIAQYEAQHGVIEVGEDG